MRIVRGKEKQLGAALLDYPADRFGRMGRELELAANIVRRLSSATPGPARCATKACWATSSRRSHDGTHSAPNSITPPRRRGNCSSVPSSTIVLTKRLGGRVQHHESPGIEGFARTDEADDRPAVVVAISVGHRRGPDANVQHERDVGVLQAAPDAVESVMGGRFVTGRCRRNPEGAAAQLEPGVDFALGAARRRPAG